MESHDTFEQNQLANFPNSARLLFSVPVRPHRSGDGFSWFGTGGTVTDAPSA
jgi:hypothetical protein